MLLQEVKQMFISDQVSYKNKSIPIVRVDINKFRDFNKIEQLSFKTIPRIFLYSKGQYYGYDGGFNVETLLNFINRHLYPVALLKTLSDLNNYLNISQEWKENTPFYKSKYQEIGINIDNKNKITRVIALDLDKYESQELKDVAMKLGNREDLRIAKVSKSLLKGAKQHLIKTTKIDINDNSLVLVLKVRDSDFPSFKTYDFSTESSLVYGWINEKSLEPLEELSPDAFKIVNLGERPMFLAFINREDQRYKEKSLDLYNKLTEIAPQFPQFVFMFTEDTQNESKKRYLGITWKEEPAMALNSAEISDPIVFPRRRPFTKKYIKQFINDFLDGKIESTRISHSFNNEYIEIMPNVKHLSAKTFTNECLKQGTDVLLLFYDAHADEEENTIVSKFLEKAAKRFKDLSIESLKIVAYDIYEHSIPDEIEYTQDLPQLIIFPAYHKDPPYKYVQDIRTKRLMKKVQANVDIKFDLPENFHLNEEELKRFEEGLPFEDL